jgi:hypothetical protein
MEQQDPILAVADDDAHGVAFEDRQVAGELDHPILRHTASR